MMRTWNLLQRRHARRARGRRSTPDAARRLVSAAHARATILVEGWSDQAALEALARRRGHPLAPEGIVVVPIGGATNVQRFVQALGPRGLGVRLARPCDVAELRHVRRGLERAGVATSAGIEDHGFYPCDADLEDELIRAFGTEAVERVLEAEGELAVEERIICDFERMICDSLSGRQSKRSAAFRST